MPESINIHLYLKDVRQLRYSIAPEVDAKHRVNALNSQTLTPGEESSLRQTVSVVPGIEEGCSGLARRSTSCTPSASLSSVLDVYEVKQRQNRRRLQLPFGSAARLRLQCF